nr:11-oxo-beta-amyrin 30-oxidase [Quercus suber]
MGSLDVDRSSWRRVAWMMAGVDDGGGGSETCSSEAWRLFFGDSKDSSMMIKQDCSKPIDLSDDILLLVLLFDHHTVKHYGKNSFTWFAPRPCVNIMSPEQIKDVFTKIEKWFYKSLVRTNHHFNGLTHLKFVTMILNEALRLYPPAASLHRIDDKETKLGNLIIPAGVEIVLPIILVHHDYELWGESANRFNPERFSEGISKATKGPVSFFPFSGDPRVYVGQNFALIETKMALSLILQNFSFGTSSSYAHAPCSIITVQSQFGTHIILHKI